MGPRSPKHGECDRIILRMMPGTDWANWATVYPGNLKRKIAHPSDIFPRWLSRHRGGREGGCKRANAERVVSLEICRRDLPNAAIVVCAPPLRLVGETRLVYQVFVEGGVFSCVLRILPLIYGITGIPLEASEGTKRTEQRWRLQLLFVRDRGMIQNGKLVSEFQCNPMQSNAIQGVVRQGPTNDPTTAL